MKRAVKKQKPKQGIPLKKKQADAILTGDWHLQETTPIARTDDFWNMQWKKLDFISKLQKKHNCPVVHSGDLFEHWKPSPMLLSKTIEHLPKWFWTVYGNHDLPQHNLELAYKSGIHVLERAVQLTVLNNCHWLQQPEKGKCSYQGQFAKNLNRSMLVWHTMCYQGKKPWPNCTDPKASKLLRKYPEYDLILTGHNHKPFVETYQGRLLVNPGSIFRLKADQQDHKPRVYLWYADTNTVDAVYLPIEENVISREHLEIKQKRDNRIDAFISTLDTDWEAKMSFEDNIEVFRKKNKVKKSVMEIVYDAIQ